VGVMAILDKLNLMLSEGRVSDVYSFVRYMYRVGTPVVSDSFYDKLHAYCVQNGIAPEYTNRTYDDDPIPYELLKELGVEPIVPEEVYRERQELYRYLDEEKSLSIMPVTEYSDAWNYFQSVRGQRLVMSIKVDGIFTKRLIMNGQLMLALSRGRKGNAWDMTDTLALVVPSYHEELTGEVKIYSESFVMTEALNVLKEKYDSHLPPDLRRFKTEKSAAITMLRKKHDVEDYRFVRSLVFNAEGLGTKVSEILEKAKSLGLETVPYLVIEPEEVPSTMEEFKEWLQAKLIVMWELKGNIPSDGVVVEVDDLSYAGDITNQYSSRNIALKLGDWSFNYYPAIVKDILTDEQRRVECACKVTIEPVYANDGTKATTINVFNPRILISNGINVGSKIYFERNSGAVNILLHGGRFKKLLLDREGEDG
jgi:NAD-dependent DNA ligase